jgi:hypothetical protein
MVVLVAVFLEGLESVGVRGGLEAVYGGGLDLVQAECPHTVHQGDF